MVAGSDAHSDGAEPLAHFVEHRRHGRIVREQCEQRRLVRNDSSKEVGALARQPKRDRRSKRGSGDPGRPEPGVLDQGGKIGDILAHAALAPWALAFAVAAPVVCENSK